MVLLLRKSIYTRLGYLLPSNPLVLYTSNVFCTTRPCLDPGLHPRLHDTDPRHQRPPSQNLQLSLTVITDNRLTSLRTITVGRYIQLTSSTSLSPPLTWAIFLQFLPIPSESFPLTS